MDQQQQQQQDLGGVQPYVFSAVMNLCDDLKDPSRRWLATTGMMNAVIISENDAFFLVAELEAILLEELAARVAAPAPAAGGNNSSIDSTTNNNRSTGLLLDANCLSQQAVLVFSEYFQQTDDEDIHLLALYLIRPNAALLSSLHNNTSIKDLYIHSVYEQDGDDAMGQCIGQLLQHKNDFKSLWFEGIGGSDTLSHVLPFLRRKHPHLKKLGFVDCVLYDNDMELLIRAMLQGGDYRNLQVLSFANNELESHALRWFSALDPANFPRLEHLDVSGNPRLLEDKDITNHFVQQVVSAQGTALKGLNVSFCSDKNQGHPTIIIKALANHNTPLVSLDLTCWTDDDLCNRQAIRNELVESLPNMKNIVHLKFNEQVFDNNDQELSTAFSKNTSILKLSSNDHGADTEQRCTAPRFVAVLKRNNDMVHVRQMLCSGTTAKTTITSSIPPVPCGLWPRVLAKVGHGGYGASPAFMILQARLAAGWPESNIKNNKRKRNEP